MPGSAGQGLNGRAGRRLGSCPRRLTARGPPWAPRPVSPDGPRRHWATHAPTPSKHGHSYGDATPRGHTSARSTPGCQDTGGWGTGMTPKTAVRGGGSGGRAPHNQPATRALARELRGDAPERGSPGRAPLPDVEEPPSDPRSGAEDPPRPPSGMRRPQPPAVWAGRSASGTELGPGAEGPELGGGRHVRVRDGPQEGRGQTACSVPGAWPASGAEA